MVKVNLDKADFVLNNWDAIQWTGDNAENVFRFLVCMPDWNMSVDGSTEPPTLSIRRDYDEHSSREWILDILDWILISPFDSLHVLSPEEFGEAFSV